MWLRCSSRVPACGGWRWDDGIDQVDEGASEGHESGDEEVHEAKELRSVEATSTTMALADRRKLVIIDVFILLLKVCLSLSKVR
jgi:hypothetical protein